MKTHDLIVAILAVALLLALSIPYFHFDYWAESAASWVVYFVVAPVLAVYVVVAFLQSTRRIIAAEKARDEEREAGRRRLALAIFGAMVVILIVLSDLSFMKSTRSRPDPQMIVFQGQTAVEGKRVYQAYNCMGCHTVVGNGAYFAPDITSVYATNGPAWLMAWLSSPVVWPARPAVDQWIDRLRKSGDLDVATVDAYYERFDGAASDAAARGGWGSTMPKLPFREGEMAALVAFLNYTSQLNTEGWPPEPRANPDIVDRVQSDLHRAFPGPHLSPTPAAPGQ